MTRDPAARHSCRSFSSPHDRRPSGGGRSGWSWRSPSRARSRPVRPPPPPSGPSSTWPWAWPAACCFISSWARRDRRMRPRVAADCSSPWPGPSSSPVARATTSIFPRSITNLILGFILANTGGAHGDVAGLLRATERPVYLALLIFAGAAWSPGSREPAVHRSSLRVGETGCPCGRRVGRGSSSAGPQLRTPRLWPGRYSPRADSPCALRD